MAPLVTFGHGTAGQDLIVELLRGAGIRHVVDVRSFPGSRANPHVHRDALAGWLPAAGIGYRWEPRLGGRRRTPADSPDGWWQVDAFRGYAAHMRTPEFLAAVSELLSGAGPGDTTVLCSETVWWRCHRRMIADFAVLVHGVPVRHLMHDGRLPDHQVSAGARLGDDGLLYYDLP